MKYLHIKEILLFILCPRTVQFYFVSYIILIDGSTSLNVKQMKLREYPLFYLNYLYTLV